MTSVKSIFCCKSTGRVGFNLQLNCRNVAAIISLSPPHDSISGYDQHCDATESRVNFGISVGNQNHPKLTTRTHDFTHKF